jgi:hypothetical protein
LLRDHKVVLPVMSHGGRVWCRFSANIYNSKQEYVALMDLIDSIVQKKEYVVHRFRALFVGLTHIPSLAGTRLIRLRISCPAIGSFRLLWSTCVPNRTKSNTARLLLTTRRSLQL